MDKIYGSTKRQDGLYRIGFSIWEIIYGFGKDNPNDYSGWDWRKRFSHRPSMEEIKTEIESVISAEADERKRTGFSWKGKPVFYDEEAERNLTGLSVKLPRLGSSMFPLTYKLGNYPDGTPAFHIFNDAEEFESFTDALLTHTQECYAWAWNTKASIDWTKFETVL